MLYPYVFLSVAPIPLHDAIEEYVAIRKRKRVTEKKVTEIVDELLKAGRFDITLRIIRAGDVHFTRVKDR